MEQAHSMNTGFSVREAREGDADAIAPLVEELGYPAETRAIRQSLSRLVGREDCLVAVAQSKDRTIYGWVQALYSEALESGARVEIVGLVVASVTRRRGIGRLLVEFTEAWARRVGVPIIVVRSNVNRIESHKFYAALGFSNTKAQNVYRKSLT